MTQKQRNRLEELRVIMNDKSAYRFGMDGESISMAFIMARGYKDIEKVLYSVLTDDPENPYREEDWQDGTEALDRLRNINDL